MITKRNYIVLAVMAILCIAIVVGIRLFPWQAAYVLLVISYIFIGIGLATLVALVLGWGKQRGKENGTYT